MKTFNKMETNYTVYEIKIGKTIYHVMTAKGQFNYVNIRKVTSNPYGIVGKDFKNFDEAIKSYRNAEMKTQLLLIQTGIKKPKL